MMKLRSFINLIFHVFSILSASVEKKIKKGLQVQNSSSSRLNHHHRYLEVYWNVPSSGCKQYDVELNVTKFGIIENGNGNFNGDNITISYDPFGHFPAIIRQNNDPTNIVKKNGGIPQLGDMGYHLGELEKYLVMKYPNENFTGMGVLDMEYWRPLWSHLFESNSNYRLYRNESINLEVERHPCWGRQQQINEAEIQFNTYARMFMETTINYAKQKRPQGKWGYYGYPMCFNYSPNYNFDCPPYAKVDNDNLSWLFDASIALFPSAYISTADPVDHRETLIRARVAEGKRVSNGKPVLPYMRFRYVDRELFLSEADMKATVRAPLSMDLAGLIIWGSSSDVNSKEKCQNLENYIEKTMGPIFRQAIYHGTIPLKL